MMTLRKCLMVALTFLFFLIYSLNSYSFQSAQINSVENVLLDGPAHHGLLVNIEKNWDPNLSYYEVQLKPDTGGPYPPWAVYNTKIKPFDAKQITIPYRNGIMSLQTETLYCLKVRAVYSEAVTPWDEKCGLTLEPGGVADGDFDEDGLANSEEYALGTDPYNPDSDLDGMSDFDEVANGTDPNKALYANIFVETPNINFGSGNFFGTYPNQHKYILITNKGDQAAKIESIDVTSDQFRLTEDSSPIENILLVHIPPQNELRLPVSFLPYLRGSHQATVNIKVAYQPEPLTVSLSGAGIEIPDCNISIENETLDFGTMSAADTELAGKSIVISNVAADGSAENEAEPLTFTILTDNLGIVPGARGLSVPPGKELKLPVIIPHLSPGDYSGYLNIVPATCRQRLINVKAIAE